MHIRSFRRRVGHVLAVVAALSLTGLSGCGGARRAPSPDARRAAFPIDDAAYAKIGYRVDWIGYPDLTGRRKVEFIAPYDDAVLVLEGGSTVTCLSASDGSRRWADQLASLLTRFVALGRDGRRVLVSAEDEVFLLDIDTGTLRDRQRYAKIVSTAPVAYGGTLIYGSGTGELFAHVLTATIDRVKAWGHGFEAAIEHDPVLIGNTVGVVAQNGDVRFLDAASGALVGRNRIFKGLATNPVANGSAMFVASLDQSIYAFRPDGVMLWQHRTPVQLRVQPTARDRVVYCAVEGEGLLAFDAATGAVNWTAPGVRGTVVGISRGRLLCWDGREALLLDEARGDVVARATLPKVRLLRPDKFEDGRLYVVSESGVVARFVPR